MVWYPFSLSCSLELFYLVYNPYRLHNFSISKSLDAISKVNSTKKKVADVLTIIFSPNL